MKHLLGNHWPTQKNSLLTLAGLVLLLGVGTVAMQQRGSVDLSKFHSNSLSPATTELLQTLDGPLSITAHIADKPELHQRVLTALEPFLHVKPDITLRWESLQTPTRQQKLETKPHLALKYQGFQTRVTHLDRQRITAAFYQLSRGKQRWIAFLQGFGSKSLDDSEASGYSGLKYLLESQGYHTYSINMEQGSNTLLPDNLDVLVLPSPEKDLPAAILSKIDTWVESGKALLWLQEDSDTSHTNAELGALTNTQLLPGFVVASDAGLRAALGLRHPAVIPVTDESREDTHPITQDLRGVSLLPLTRAVESLGMPPWKSTPVLQSPVASWNETSTLKGHLERDNDRELSGPLPLMIAQSHPYGSVEQRILVGGDSDFLSNDYLGYGNNRQLALRIFGWLSGDDQQLLDMAYDTVPDATLGLSPPELIGIAVLFLLLLPGGLLLTGAILWYRRSHA